MLLTNQGTSRTILSNYQVAMQTMSYTQDGHAIVEFVAFLQGLD